MKKSEYYNDFTLIIQCCDSSIYIPPLLYKQINSKGGILYEKNMEYYR